MPKQSDIVLDFFVHCLSVGVTSHSMTRQCSLEQIPLTLVTDVSVSLFTTVFSMVHVNDIHALDTLKYIYTIITPETGGSMLSVLA